MRRVATSILFGLAWLMSIHSTSAQAFALWGEKGPFCNTPQFQAILKLPVKVPQRDLLTPLFAVNALDVRAETANCLSLEPGMTYRSLLAEYVENQWIDEVTGGTPARAATVMEAIRSAAERRRSVTDAAAAHEEFLTRRQLAYDRSFVVLVTNPSATVATWGRQIKVTVVNVSRWPLLWFSGVGGQPGLWFQATPESAPTQFVCLHAPADNDVSSIMQPGRRQDVLCNQKSMQYRDPAPAAASLSARANWSVHSFIGTPEFDSANNIDVGVWSMDVMQAGNVLLKKASCKDRDTCPRPITHNERRPTSGGSGLWPIGLAGFFIGVIVFLVVRAGTGRSAGGTAIAVSLFLVVCVTVVTALLFFIGSGTHDGFALLGLGMIWFALLTATAPALVGVWVACVLATLAGVDDDSDTQPRTERRLFVIGAGALAFGCGALYTLAHLSGSGSLFGLIFLWMAYGLAAVGALSVVILAARGTLRVARRPESDGS